jgi:putative transposase
MNFASIAKHLGIWPADKLCGTLGVCGAASMPSDTTAQSDRRSDDELGARVRSSFLASDRTYGLGAYGVTFLPKVWRADDVACRLIWASGSPAVAQNVLDRSFGEASATRKLDCRFYLHFNGKGLALCGGRPISSRAASGSPNQAPHGHALVRTRTGAPLLPTE